MQLMNGSLRAGGEEGFGKSPWEGKILQTAAASASKWRPEPGGGGLSHSEGAVGPPRAVLCRGPTVPWPQTAQVLALPVLETRGQTQCPLGYGMDKA